MESSPLDSITARLYSQVPPVMLRLLLRPLLHISSRQVEFARRGFTCSKLAVQKRLELVGKTFLHGYHSGLEEPDLEKLRHKLDQTEIEYQGFAYEGAAMALALLDGIMPRVQRFPRFLADHGRHHIYMLHVGAGWACARLPWLRRNIEFAIQKFDPVLRWLVIDGYGFHEGYFHWRRKPSAPHLSSNARHVFYQGLGRSLWFVKGADPLQIFQTIESFDQEYCGDMWSGIGLACAYAGGMNRAEIEDLRRKAGLYSTALAQGAAFAAGARRLAGNPADHTEVACTLLCGMNAESAAALCDETLSQVNTLHPCPYQQWRQLLQDKLSLSSEIPKNYCGPHPPSAALDDFKVEKQEFHPIPDLLGQKTSS